MSTQEMLQEWAKENGVTCVRFYPSNPSSSSADAILTAAHETIMNLQNGRAVAFEDPISASV